MATPTPHDSLVRSIFSQKENALVELRAILPPTLFAQLDPESLEHCPGSFVEPDLAQRHTDLLHRCRIAGRDVYVYFFFEHLSGDEPLAAFRLLKYQVNIWQDHTEKHEPALPLPPIIPILLHHSERGWKRLTEFHSLFDPVVFTLDPSLAEFTPSFRFLLDDLRGPNKTGPSWPKRRKPAEARERKGTEVPWSERNEGRRRGSAGQRREVL